jgi:hypothetical protein
MNVLHHNLETIKVTGRGRLDPVRESLNGIPVDNAIQSGEKREYVRDEVVFTVVRLYLLGVLSRCAI